VIREMKAKSPSKLMHGLSLGFCLFWVCFAPAGGVNAQSAGVPDRSGAQFRLLTAAEGRAVVTAALEQGQVSGEAQDCSHVVHQIYLDAGFEYPYASSFEIYSGSENFARVKTPHAGDLIAWPGHVGIVINPVEHSFYSLVSTGLGTQDYDGPYWNSRGRPRFYRYRVLRSEILNAGKKVPSQRNTNAKKQDRAVMAPDEPSPAGRVNSNQPSKTVSDRKAVLYTPQNPEITEASSESAEIATSIPIATGTKQPTRDEVAKAISELSNDAGSILRNDDPLKLSSPVVIFERFSVEKVELKRDHGWAHLKIASRVLLAGGETEFKRRDEKVRCELRRTKLEWEVIAPTGRTYVPQDVAVRNLAAQLAQLAEQDNPSPNQEVTLRRESQLANLLSGLLEKK
jgi:hypothetical protein